MSSVPLSMFPAHIKTIDNVNITHTVEEHLRDVGNLSATYGSKINLPSTTKLIGLVHDLGKLRHKFKNYIESATGVIDQDADDYIDSKQYKGHIDHSTAGAQYIYALLKNKCQIKGEQSINIAMNIILISIVSHHSGLLDMVQDDEHTLVKRMKKSIYDNEDFSTGLYEVCKNIDNHSLKDDINNSIISGFNELVAFINPIVKEFQNAHTRKIAHFNIGMVTKFIFSCLIDADRIDTAEFFSSFRKHVRLSQTSIHWDTPINKMEDMLNSFNGKDTLSTIRRHIADVCLNASVRNHRSFSLTVPTGGGKTLSSLRFALNHAKTFNKDRIIYVIPYCSIIEQNAQAIREVIEDKNTEGDWVLESHSNTDIEKDTFKNKIVSENWDRPIVFITMVQFLETLFGSRTGNTRKLHQIANSVVIFDEIQTLPIKCVHIFNNAMNFMMEYCNTTTVLCSATQPTLDALPDASQIYGKYKEPVEIISDVDALFQKLKRVNITFDIKTKKSNTETVNLIYDKFKKYENVLCIVNTKKLARDLYLILSNMNIDGVFHLSTSQCPIHRKEILKTIKSRIKNNLPTICISTQLIEAGVDISFRSVVRCMAGVDSIIQAAGRCNRNNEMVGGLYGDVTVIDCEEDKSDALIDLRYSKQVTKSLSINRSYLEVETQDLITSYFNKLYSDRRNELRGEEDTETGNRLFDLLSTTNAVSNSMSQQFKTASNLFKAIDSPTFPVIVPYNNSKKLVYDMESAIVSDDLQTYYQLKKEVNGYVVNLFENDLNKLVDSGMIITLKESGILLVDDAAYSPEYGIIFGT